MGKLAILMMLLVILSGCAKGPTDEQRARTLLNEGMTLKRSGDHAKAKHVLNSLASKYGHTPEATEANALLAADEESDRKLGKVTLQAAVLAFYGDLGRFPTQDEAFTVLIKGTGVKGWKGPYLEVDERENVMVLDSEESNST